MRGLPILFAIAAVATHGVGAPSADPWQVIKVGAHDYLSVDNIAKFYGLPLGVSPVNKRIKIANEKGSLEFALDNREININGARNWLCFPVIEKDGKYLVSRMDLAKTIEPQMRPHMITSVRKLTTVVLDAGHGGHDKGAPSKYGYEKDYALDVARKLRPLLRAKGLKVIMTRDGDYFVPLEVRARIANKASDAIFVSIHFNATDRDPAASGFEIYCLTPRGAPSTYDDSLALSFMNVQPGTGVDTHSVGVAACVYHSILGHTDERDRGIKRARFAVLRLTQIPSVLIEGGFMTELGESKMIAKKEWRADFARAISIGIENYRALAEKRQKPMTVADYRKQTKSSPAVEFAPSKTELTLLAPTMEALSLAPEPPPSVPDSTSSVPAPSATPAATPISLQVSLPSPTP